MKVYNQKEAYKELYKIIHKDVEGGFIGVVEETAVHHGYEEEFDKNAAKEYNIPIYDIKRGGGAFVTSPGDVVYCYFIKTKQKNLNKELGGFIKEKLQQRGITSANLDNDLLIDGFKCAGFMDVCINGRYFYGGHISINCNLELIQKICTKKMEKIPKGLSDYDISTENVIEWIQDFFKNKKDH